MNMPTTEYAPNSTEEDELPQRPIVWQNYLICTAIGNKQPCNQNHT